MNYDLVSFFLGAAVLFCGIMVISVSNQIHALFYLIGCFIIITISLLVRYDIEFVAFLITIVYIGAVAILFLFIVMMIDVKTPATGYLYKSKARASFLMPWLLVCWFVAYYYFAQNDSDISALVVDQDIHGASVNNDYWLDMINTQSLEGGDLRELSRVLYTVYGIPFVLASYVLFVAMLGAISLTLKHKPFVKRQDIYLQTNRSFEEAVRRHK